MVTMDISINASNIWHLLSEKGRLSLREIAEFTRYHETLVHSALGWLSREDKIEISSQNGSTFVELKQTFTDIYY